MKLKYFLVFASIVPALFGIGLLFAPSMFLSNNGIAVNDSAILFARSVGYMLLGLAWINWSARNSEITSVVKGIILGNIILHVLALVVDAMAANAGVITKNPAFGIVVHLVFIIGFGYFLLKSHQAYT